MVAQVNSWLTSTSTEAPLTDLLRTPAGPLETSPSLDSPASSADTVARNKTVCALFDKAESSSSAEHQAADDFDIPAVRNRTLENSRLSSTLSLRGRATADLADLPLSDFKARWDGVHLFAFT